MQRQRKLLGGAVAVVDPYFEGGKEVVRVTLWGTPEQLEIDCPDVCQELKLYNFWESYYTMKEMKGD